MFLDESGDHSMDVIDPQYPLFVLGGCIMDKSYHEKILTPRLREYKKNLFGTDDFILHTADIKRQKGVFQKLSDAAFRERFYIETNLLMNELEYMVVACVIKKDEHLSMYGRAALSPYILSLRILVERFVYEIQKRGDGIPGDIIAESRDDTLNKELQIAWMALRNSGTGYVSASVVKRYVSKLYIRDKKKGIAGLQVADMVVSPIGRHIINKKDLKPDWEIIKRKFRKSDKGLYKGYGLVMLPIRKEDE